MKVTVDNEESEKSIREIKVKLIKSISGLDVGIEKRTKKMLCL